jgi:hypothetical protein
MARCAFCEAPWARGEHIGRGLGPLVSCSQIPNDTGLVNRTRTERFQIYNRAEEAVSVRNLTPEHSLFAQLATKLSQ